MDGNFFVSNKGNLRRKRGRPRKEGRDEGGEAKPKRGDEEDDKSQRRTTADSEQKVLWDSLIVSPYPQSVPEDTETENVRFIDLVDETETYGRGARSTPQLFRI
jgi:hypothetical protein